MQLIAFRDRTQIQRMSVSETQMPPLSRHYASVHLTIAATSDFAVSSLTSWHLCSLPFRDAGIFAYRSHMYAGIVLLQQRCGTAKGTLCAESAQSLPVKIVLS